MSQAVVLIGGCWAVTAAIKGAGPVALGGRQLPRWFGAVVALLAPALLSALVASQALADGDRLAVGADTVGVAASAVVMWRTRSALACVVTAIVVTGVLRNL